jgi:AcrR family transcriptional regulator
MGADGVKGARRYESPRRRAQAEATRAEILEAGRRLFAARGYAATTMSAIAREAGVALKTVYLAFETKSGLLRALWHLLLRGDEGDVPMTERPWFRAVLAEPDPAARMAMLARTGVEVKLRAAPLMEVIRTAAPSDPEIAALWARIEEQFRGLLGQAVAGMAEAGHLRPGLDDAAAADLLWTLHHPDVWRALVVVRGWAPERYEAWLTAATRRELLAAA